MNNDQIETMYKAFFEELTGIEKEAMEKQALSLPGAAQMGQWGRGIAGALKSGVKDPTAMGKVIKQTYTQAGGGLHGVGQVLRSQPGQAAALAGGAALAVPAAAGFSAGRAAP